MDNEKTPSRFKYLRGRLGEITQRLARRSMNIQSSYPVTALPTIAEMVIDLIRQQAFTVPEKTFSYSSAQKKDIDPSYKDSRFLRHTPWTKQDIRPGSLRFELNAALLSSDDREFIYDILDELREQLVEAEHFMEWYGTLNEGYKDIIDRMQNYEREVKRREQAEATIESLRETIELQHNRILVLGASLGQREAL